MDPVSFPRANGCLPISDRFAFALDPTVSLVVIYELFRVDCVASLKAIGFDVINFWWNENRALLIG